MMRTLGRCAAIAATIAMFAACSRDVPGRLPPNTERVADGVYLFQHGGNRSLFLVSDDGVIVTDPLNAAAAGEYRQAIAALTDQPVKFVVYSHYHWDRVAGAGVFAAEGAQVIAQARCAERFRVNPNPAVVTPDIVFDDRYDVTVGRQTLELHYFGPAHGDCLTVFLVQPAGLMQIVDLVEPPRAAFPSNPNVPYVKPHNLRQFFAAVETLATDRDVSQVLASHARLVDDGSGGRQLSPPTASAAIIADQARFWQAVYATVETARRAGNVGIDSFVRMRKVDLTPFESFDGYSKDDLRIIMRRFVGFYDMGR